MDGLLKPPEAASKHLGQISLGTAAVTSAAACPIPAPLLDPQNPADNLVVGTDRYEMLPLRWPHALQLSIWILQTFRKALWRLLQVSMQWQWNEMCVCRAGMLSDAQLKQIRLLRGDLTGKPADGQSSRQGSTMSNLSLLTVSET